MKKKLIIATAMLMAIMNCTAFASNSETVTDGTVVDYNIYEVSIVDGEVTENAVTGQDKIDEMIAEGKTPGTKFYVGDKLYEVGDNYEIVYLGRDSNVDTNVINDRTRGTSIPTREGSLPYSENYEFRNYIYSSRYFNLGGGPHDTNSIAVTISADNEQTIEVDWMDARNDESMGSKTYYFNRADELTKYVWVYSGEDFYFKFTNGDSAFGDISGSYLAEVDQ